MATIHPKQIETLKTTAGRLYRSFDQARRPEVIAMFGEPSNPMACATAEEIFDFLLLVEQMSVEEEWRLEYTNYPYGTPAEAIRADAQARKSRDTRRNSVRALKAKYGHDGADRIVFKHSGRHIR